MRHIYQGTFKDLNGAVVGSLTTSDGNAGTVTVYLDDGTTAADVYAAATGGAAVNSVSTDTYGHFVFYVDDSEYMPTQLFTIVLSHTDVQSKTYENIRIITDDPYKYYCDATATDQGIATTRADRSLCDLIATISTDSADIVLANSSGSGTTTYTLTTSDAIPANINLIPENGAIIDGAGTLTLDSANQIIAAPGQTIFGSSVTVTFTNGGKAESGWFNTLTQGVASGADIHIIEATHTLTATCSPSSGQTIFGDGDTSLVNLGGNVSAFTIDGKSNVILKDFKIDGKKATYTTNTNIGVTSPANATGSSNVKLSGLTVTDFAGNAIQFLAQTGSHSSNIKIVGNEINNPGGGGIVCQDFVDDVVVINNRVYNYGDDIASKIGISVGRDAINQQVIGNYVWSDGGAGGASAHGISIDKTENFVCNSNIVTGSTGYGIEVGNSQNGTVDGNETYSTTRSGVGIIGDEAVQTCKHVTVTGNTIWEPATSAGIYATVSNQSAAFNEDLIIVGNNIHNAKAGNGILIDECLNGVVSDNLIVDSYTDGIRFEDSSFFIVNGNLLKGSNSSDTAARQLGVVKSSSTSIIVNGFGEVDTTDTVSSGTGEDDLKTYSIPQETYNDWRGMRVTAAGIKTGANGNKTLKFHIGSSSLTFNAAANDVVDWVFKADIPFYAPTAASDSYYVIWMGFNGATPLTGYEYWAEDNTAGAVTMKITGECADGGDVITQNTWMVEFY